jgi:hypothetical protein
MSESSKVDPLERGPKPRRTTGFGADFVHPVLAAYAAEGNQAPVEPEGTICQADLTSPVYKAYMEEREYLM